jgi:uncharacterized protein YbjT (DUF2867 family)
MTVLVVGASGRLGLKIVRELVAAGARVRATHRASSKREQVDRLREAGAEVIAADLADSASLLEACTGIEVVVSAVQGLRDVIVDGQTRLLRAAEQAGVARMLPSDYAIDFFKTDEGGNRNLDLRREFNRACDGSRVRPTSVLCGAFMDLLAFGAMGPDPKTNVYRVYGDPDQPYDFTLTDDVARYIAAAALDKDAPRMLRVAGDTKSPRELAAIFEDVRKTPVTLEVVGSVADLDAQIERMRAADEAPTNPFPVWQRMQYARDMARGQGRLVPLDNARYPQIKPTTVRELLSAPPRA